MKRMLVMVALALTTACSGSHGTEDSAVDADLSDVGQTDTGGDANSFWPEGSPFTATVSNRVDLLVVLDWHTVTSYRSRVPLSWIASELVIGSPETGPIDVNMGFISPDLGDPSGTRCELSSPLAGRLIPCSATGSSAVLELRTDTIDGFDLARESTCRGRPSTSTEARDCVIVQPLEALLSAMLPSAAEFELNAGASYGDSENSSFFRHDAFLMVLILSGPDDCSLADPLLASAERYGGASGFGARCYDHPDALRPVSRYTEALLRVRGPSTFGVYAFGALPSELSGTDVGDVSRFLDSHEQVSGSFSISREWDPDHGVRTSDRTKPPPQRLLHLLVGLESAGVDVAAFSVFGEMDDSRNPFLEPARQVTHHVFRTLEALPQ